MKTSKAVRLRHEFANSQNAQAQALFDLRRQIAQIQDDLDALRHELDDLRYSGAFRPRGAR